MIIEKVTVERNIRLASGIFETVFQCGDNVPQINAGQFINVYPNDPQKTLPRPISVCDVIENRLKIVYQVVGGGTKEFSSYTPGETVKLMYPLGNGFSLGNEKERHVLIGGGVGAAPLLYLAKTLKGHISVFLGFGNEPILVDEFKEITDAVYVSTETGEYGEKGNVLDILKKYDNDGSLYYVCGPRPMLKGACNYFNEKGAKGQISLEERMGCGFGVCVGCAVKIKKDDGWQYLKVCSDGPVFDFKEVLWD